MIKPYNSQKDFYGLTTLGEKGQVVIPAAARTTLLLKKGEKMLVFGMSKDILVLAKVKHLEQFASHLSQKLKTINEIIKKTKLK